MRKFVVLLLAIAAFAEPVHRPAPEFAIQSPGGKQTLLSAYKGKTIVLAFMHTTCTHCQKTAGILNDVQKQYGDRGVQVVGVMFDEGAAKRIKSFNRVFEVAYPSGYSNEKAVLEFLHHPASEPYLVPMLVFIDKNFNISSQYIGDATFFGEETTNIRQELDKMLK